MPRAFEEKAIKKSAGRACFETILGMKQSGIQREQARAAIYFEPPAYL